MMRRLFYAIALVLGASPAAWAGPGRIVSINLCADTLVLELAPRAAIASLSYLVADARVSPKALEARGIALNHGAAEEVLALRPDLVVAGRYSGRATVELLRGFGVALVELDNPSTLAALRTQIRDLAAVLGVGARGEAVIAAMDARIAAARAPAFGPRPLTAIYQADGFTSGNGSLADDLLTQAGLDNLAARLGMGPWGHFSLEQLLAAAPDILVLGASGESHPSLAEQLLRHPALRRVRQHALSVTLPDRLWSCAGPWVAEAVERLAVARRAWSHDAKPGS